jgi:hypothetical protein
MTNLPQNGQIIFFTAIPTASYTQTGEAYRVEHKGRDYRFVSVERGCSTYDPQWAVARSQWQVA